VGMKIGGFLNKLFGTDSDKSGDKKSAPDSPASSPKTPPAKK